MKKRLLAFMVSICMTITMLPATFAVENKDSEYDNASDVRDIVEIVPVFGGDTISKQVNDTNASADYTTAVSSYPELQSRLEALESKYVGTTWKNYYYGRECKGFASFTFNNLFCNGYIGKTGSNNYTIPTLNGAYSIGTSTNIDVDAAKSLLSQSDIGDFIQVKRRSLGGPHSMIVAGVDDNGIWIFDCNATTYCLVQKYYQTWSTFASKNISVSVYRATNYPSKDIVNNPVDIGTNFAACIIQKSNWATVVNNNSNAEIGTGVGNATEHWWFERQSDGTYTIMSLEDGKYLDVAEAGNQDGLNIYAYDYTGADNQRWYISEGSYGFIIIPKCATASCMDCTDGGTSVGTNIQLFTQNNSAAQGFSIYKINGIPKFQNIGTNFAACIIQKSNWATVVNNNSNAEIGTGVGNATEHWWFKRQNDGTYTIMSLEDGKYLDVAEAGNQDGLNIYAYDYTGVDNQRWYISEGLYGSIIIPKCATTSCMDCTGGGTSVGTNIQLFTQNNSAAQGFSIYKLDNIPKHNNIGTEFIAKIYKMEGMIPIVNNSSNIELGEDIEIASCYWKFKRQEDGTYTIMSLENGKFMDVAEGGNRDGLNIYTYNYTGANNQRWYLIKESDGYIFVPQCATSSCIDVLNNGNAIKTNIQLWTQNNSTAQKYVIAKINAPNLEAPVIKASNYSDDNGNNVQFIWDACTDATGYNLSVYDENSETELYTYNNIKDTVYNVHLPAGTYTAVVTAVYDRFNIKQSSEAVTFKVRETLAITTQPSDFTGVVGANATFTVEATGNSLTYQWQYANAGQEDVWRNSSQTGNTTTTLTVPITAARDGQKYRVVITDANGNVVTSNVATLKTKAPVITITTQPSNYTGRIGETATFTVKATGDGLTYQWQYANAGQEDTWRASSQTGNKTTTLTVPITAARDGQKYRVVITDANGNVVTSNVVTLKTKTPVITITTQPSDYTGAVGTTATFTVKATGNSLTYQWQYANAGQEDAWRASSQTGNNTATLSVPITAARDGQKYRVVITDGSGNTVTSNAVTLHVETVLAITSRPVDYTGAVGTTATFTVKATGDGLTYQWQYANAGQEDAWRASSQTGNKTATLSVPITAARDGQKYRVVITDSSGNTVTSNAATLKVS